MACADLCRPLLTSADPCPVSSKLRPDIRGQATRVVADGVLEAAQEAALHRCLPLPPGPPVAPPTYQLTCLRNAIFVAGRLGSILTLAM